MCYEVGVSIWFQSRESVTEVYGGFEKRVNKSLIRRESSFSPVCVTEFKHDTAGCGMNHQLQAGMFFSKWLSNVEIIEEFLSRHFRTLSRIRTLWSWGSVRVNGLLSHLDHPGRAQLT